MKINIVSPGFVFRWPGFVMFNAADVIIGIGNQKRVPRQLENDNLVESIAGIAQGLVLQFFLHRAGSRIAFFAGDIDV